MHIDIDTYTKRAGRLNLDGIDFDTFRTHPLDPSTIRCLRYMHDIEHHTVCYLRDLLATPAHADHEVTTFLTMWNFEEFWHGDAIGKVLAAHGEPNGQRRVETLRRSLRWTDRFGPTLHALGSGVVGTSYTAIHMTWGAINEWTTQAGYARLAARADHRTLTELLRRIMRQEGRHVDFYASQAMKRLAGNRRAQRLTRFALTRFWKPVGSDVMPEAEVCFLVNHLFGDDGGAAVVDRLDRNIDRLPGLDGLHLLWSAARLGAA
jgi:rubrerythrin